MVKPNQTGHFYNQEALHIVCGIIESIQRFKLGERRWSIFRPILMSGKL